MRAKYTVELGAAQGIIPETIDLFRQWDPGMDAVSLRTAVLENDVLGKATERRVKNIVHEGFFNRFIAAPSSEAAPGIKKLVESDYPVSLLREIFLIYAFRRNLIFRDFLTDTYWRGFSNGRESLEKDDVLSLIDDAVMTGKLEKKWSDSQRSRVASYVLGTAEDFRLVNKSLGRGGSRRIEMFQPHEPTLVYLAYDLHFSGSSDEAVLAHPDWEALGYAEEDVRQCFDQLTRSGELIFQDAGTMVRIDWKYKNREELTDGLIGTNI